MKTGDRVRIYNSNPVLRGTIESKEETRNEGTWYKVKCDDGEIRDYRLRSLVHTPQPYVFSEARKPDVKIGTITFRDYGNNEKWDGWTCPS